MMKASVKLVDEDLTLVANNGPGMQQYTEELQSGLLGEDELHYVDPASGVDDPPGCRYGHGHLDGVSLEDISEEISARQIAKAKMERSGRETRATSYSSSVYMERTDGCVARSPDVHEAGVADPCGSVLAGLQRAWCAVMDQLNGCGTRVEYTCRHWVSCTAVKTFSVFDSDGLGFLRGLGIVPGPFVLQIPRFRVVSTIWGKHAEFEVRVLGGGRRWTCWRRFSDFKVMATGCPEFDSDCAMAWARVLMAQPTRRCLNQEYLAVKCNLLEAFLQQVMFSMATPALLIQFLTKH